MPNEENKYVALWTKYKPVIVSCMKDAKTGTNQIYKLSGHEFEAVGNRESSGYSFNLVLINGELANNIDGTAVARDLRIVLSKSGKALELMKDAKYTIRMDKAFVLYINCETLS